MLMMHFKEDVTDDQKRKLLDAFGRMPEAMG